MPTLLHIDSSYDPNGFSRRLTSVFAEAWLARGTDHTIVRRDLHADPVPHLAHSALHWARELRGDVTVDLVEADAAQQAVLEQLLAADVLLIGAPMYNYSLPSTLKTWIDHIHVPGVTAPFGGDTQPLRGRAAVVVTTRGSAAYDEGSPTAHWDHVLPPLRLVLGDALGMRLEEVAVSRTLSQTLPSLAGERDRFDAEFAAASRRLVELASQL